MVDSESSAALAGEPAVPTALTILRRTGLGRTRHTRAACRGASRPSRPGPVRRVGPGDGPGAPAVLPSCAFDFAGYLLHLRPAAFKIWQTSKRTHTWCISKSNPLCWNPHPPKDAARCAAALFHESRTVAASAIRQRIRRLPLVTRVFLAG